jgi:AcrR family transcriptional regulator
MLTKAPPAVPRIDPRTRRTRQLIMNALNELLAEKSFEAITVQEIADRATVNRATFYAHFEDKYMLLDAAFAELFESVLHKNVPPDSKFSSVNLERLIGAICEFLEHLSQHCARSKRPQFETLVEQQVKAQLYHVLAEWLAPGAKGAPLLAEAALRANVTSWAIYAAALWWSQSARKEAAPEFARRVLPMILPGLKAPL